jgi:hypothetical protein
MRRKCIVTCIPIARQQLGTHIPARANARNNRTSVARQQISKHGSLTTEAVFSVGSVQVVIRKCSAGQNSSSRKWWVEIRDASLPGYEFGSRGIEWSCVFGIGGRRIRERKGIKWCKEDFMCDLKWQWDCYKSVALIWLRILVHVQRWTVMCVEIATALYCLLSRVVCMYKVNKSNHTIQNPSYKLRTKPPNCDSI